LQEGPFDTTDVGSNFLSQGKTQDHFFNREIQLKESHVVNAVKSFCALTPQQLTKQLKYYPLQGPASQKLALYSIQTQQQMLREAFNDFAIPVSDTKKWEESDAHKLLKTTIEKYEKENKFPYKFKVVGKDKLEITENENFKGPEGTEKWKDTNKGVTNPELVLAAKNGHIKIIKFLLSQGADIKYASLINGQLQGNVLEVAIRWSNFEVVEYLLSDKVDAKWSKSEIQQAKKLNRKYPNEKIKRVI
jgi:hypothetical protein